ncbi:MAG: T9SS type A sorting domain-containing protein [Spirosomataceae bacterium]
MKTNRLRNLFLVLPCFCFCSHVLFAQNCTNVFQPSTTNGTIGWKKFPEFSLPFTNIYNGPRFGDTERLPLTHGFTHITNLSGDDEVKLERKNRALIWYSVAYVDTPGKQQPWELIESPWNNNMTFLRERWNEQLKGMAERWVDTRSKKMPEVDLFVLDAERQIATDLGILNLRKESLVPATYKSLSDEVFITRYKRDMQKLYAEPLKWAYANGLSTSTKISAYSDAPIRNTFINVDGNTWQDWRTNTDRLNYLVQDTLTKQAGGVYFNQHNFITPSAYLYYNYPSPFGGQYLAYTLFQVEANRAWSNKDVILFEWLRFHDCCDATSALKFVRPFQAEAMAIFPYFSGAKGIWLWDMTLPPTENYSVYEYFINGLYRLSQFKDFFTGDYQLYIPKSARDHFEDRDPIWRAVVKGNQLLVAAHNPYATDTQVTEMPIKFGGFSTTIQLKGTEVFLCKFDMPTDDTALSEVLLSPNPNKGDFQLKYFLRQAKTIDIQIHDVLGHPIYSQQVNAKAGENYQSFSLPQAGNALYFLTLKDDKTVKQTKFWILK